MHVKYLISGAGPTGLGAGHRLQELGENDFLILERNDYVGGLSASFTDEAGFTWDVGGHVLFSHFDYYDRLVEQALGGEYLEHQRIAAIRIAGGWTPYPFQNNIRTLPRALQWECVQGLLPGHRRMEPPGNFGEWIDHIFGPGIGRLFMRPYNFKVWAAPPEHLDFHWIGERVSVVNLERTLENLILDRPDVGWGPNSVFRFPLHGGTGQIFRAIASGIAPHIRTGQEIVFIDPASRSVRTRQGQEYTYERLLSTGPLDQLVLDLLREPASTLIEAAATLEHNGVYVAGVGVDGVREDPTCWMYFPEDNCPYYRLTNFHNYSPNNTARPGQQRALMAETSFSRYKPEDFPRLMDRTIDGMEATGMIGPDERQNVRSRWEMRVEYGYPLPTLGRDAALRTLIPALESLDIYSRGRFGGWKYEVANMDHSVMQGVQWAERMLLGQRETVYEVT